MHKRFLFFILVFFVSLVASEQPIYADCFGISEAKETTFQSGAKQFKEGSTICVGVQQGTGVGPPFAIRTCQNNTFYSVASVSCGTECTDGSTFSDNPQATCPALTPSPTLTPIPTVEGPAPDCTFTDTDIPGANALVKNGTATCIGQWLAVCSGSQPVKSKELCFDLANNKQKRCEITGTASAACIDGAPDAGDDGKCSYAAPEGQQVMPRPGVNCGVPENEVTGTMDQNAKYCCSSSLTKEELVSLACFIRIPGGQSFLEGLSKTINENLNNFPFVFLDSTAAENVNLPNFKGFREGLEKIDPCMSGTMLDGSGDSPGSPGCRCLRPQAGNSLAAYCDRISADNPAEILECKKCMLKLDASNNPIPGEAGNGIWTALGCIDISSEGGFVQGLLSLGVSLGGAFAILCNIYAAFLLQTSAGNPERINKARSLIISCVTGLLLIIFSIFILNLIGYRILRIPGLGP